MTKNKNRRVFFRIYDEVNLLYTKIDEKQLADPRPVFDTILNENLLSITIEKNATQLKKNDTRNVNISASGMAFMCEDALKEGDYLAIKITLAGISNIVTYAKVVYCKNSTASDISYPYFVGAHFIAMKEEYQELLDKHVNKKRLQQIWINSFLLTTVLAIIAAPAAIFGLLLELLHFLLELFLELSHLGFEFIESNLDKLIEHFFETNLHQTQVIVFYIILPVVVYGLYRLCRALPPFCLRFKKNQLACWSRKKASLLYYWQEQSLVKKVMLVAISVAAISGYVFFGI